MIVQNPAILAALTRIVNDCFLDRINYLQDHQTESGDEKLVQFGSSKSDNMLEQHQKFVEELIDLDCDEDLKHSALLFQKVVEDLEASYARPQRSCPLSGQKTVKQRQSWHRYEGDKLRLIWTRFLELSQSKGSNNNAVRILKMRFRDYLFNANNCIREKKLLPK